MNTMAHSPNGWVNFCLTCKRAYFAAWLAHSATVKRMELDEVTPHKCEEK